MKKTSVKIYQMHYSIFRSEKKILKAMYEILVESHLEFCL